MKPALAPGSEGPVDVRNVRVGSAGGGRHGSIHNHDGARVSQEQHLSGSLRPGHLGGRAARTREPRMQCLGPGRGGRGRAGGWRDEEWEDVSASLD